MKIAPKKYEISNRQLKRLINSEYNKKKYLKKNINKDLKSRIFFILMLKPNVL